MARSTSLSILVALGLVAGCGYDENLPSADLTGVVRLPKEAMDIELTDPTTGEPMIVNDLRALGPVYLGAFPSVSEGYFDYPHPEMGPIIDKDQVGDTYPYGGTSVGRFDWACYQSMVCKVVTGRYQSYEEMLTFFSDVLKNPVTGPDGEEITDPELFQERCYDVYYVTSDDELGFLNRDNDFEDKGDYIEAQVTIPHVNWVEGMQLWGWMDMPSYEFNFATCDSEAGQLYSRYSESYYMGTNRSGLLNRPSDFIDVGDWIVQDAPVITDPSEEFVLELGFHYVE